MVLMVGAVLLPWLLGALGLLRDTVEVVGNTIVLHAFPPTSSGRRPRSSGSRCTRCC